MKLLPSSLLLLTFTGAVLRAQTPLLNWTQSWDYMHPMGVLPDAPAGGADTDFDTTWYLESSDFAAQYNGPEFGGVQTAGNTGVPNSYDHGSGAGPLGYDVMDYWTTASALFTSNATLLTQPASGSRHTAYFRTTFTVPNDGSLYAQPVINYLMDDGGFIYLDGVLVMTVNMPAGATDTYNQFATNATLNENQIRSGDLSLPAGTVTGIGLSGAAGNATIVQSISTLSAGEHTLAVSLHQVNATSSDIGLAIELTAGPVVQGITGVKLNDTRRSLNGTPDNAADDTVDFAITVEGSGSASGWKVTGPPGSSLLGQTGNYRVARPFIAVPLSEFGESGLTLTLQDADNPAFTSTVTVTAPLPVLDWSHAWDYMQPMGLFPDRPAGGVDEDFDTTWYLKKADFTAQYDGPEIGGVNTAGDPLVTNSYDHGSGAGPLGFDVSDYWNTAGALFTANATPLTVPASGSRFTGYFRTTFTVPNDGSTWGRPVMTYLMDDGGFVYLDGVLIMEVNMGPAATNAYTQLALNATDTENQLRVADLTLPAGTATGALTTSGVTNATVLQPVSSLAPGEHTLAISVHQSAATSSDMELAVRLDVVPVTGGNPGGGDTDGDGVSDANEAIMGTDPNNATDVLRLAQVAGTPNQITFNSKAGKYYHVYTSTDLGAWTDSGLTTIPGDNTAKQFNIPTPVPGQRRFFRLHVMGADGPWPATYP